MVAHSARTSSSAEAARSSHEEERLLMKRSIEWQWANTWETLCEREKAKTNFDDQDSDVTFSLETNLSHDGPRRSRSRVISAPQ